MLEREIRGRLSVSEFRKVLKILRKDGEQKDHYLRLSVDLSPGFNPKTRKWNKAGSLDLRVKRSGRNDKICLKIGGFHSEKRQEIDVDLKDGELPKAVILLEALGFGKGMIYLWESWEFKYQGFEVKLSKYSKDYFTWEIETKKKDKDPRKLAKQLGLKPFTKNEYWKAVDWENQHIHKLYSKRALKKALANF